jgi:hypothetical protein
MRIDIPVSVAPELLVSTSKGELFSLKELAGMSNTEMTVAAQAKVHFSKCHGVQSLTLANYGGKTLRVEFENLTEVQSYFANVNGEVVLQLQVFYVPANGEPRDPMTSGSYTWSVVVE